MFLVDFNSRTHMANKNMITLFGKPYHIMIQIRS
jgi:hypothetical protein